MAALALVVGSAAAVSLVENGEARAEIVLPEGAWPAERLAASELRFLLKKASGAELAIVEKGKDRAGFAKVLVGRAAGLGSFAPFAGKVVAEGKVLKIAGGDSPGDTKKSDTQCGTLYAAYEFETASWARASSGRTTGSAW